MSHRNVVLLVLLSVVLLPGCAQKNWQPHWQEPGLLAASPPAASASTDLLYTEAMELYQRAGDHAGVLAAIQAMERVLATDPDHRGALADLANLHILLGTAYTSGQEEKNAHFHRAMQLCEWSMYQNPRFRAEIEAGKMPWEAASVLQAEDAPAMLFWVTALQYEFKEGMTLAEKIVNVGWLQHSLAFLHRIREAAPEFGNGAVEFAFSISYSALPSWMGGDTGLGGKYLEQSLTRGQGYLLPTWGKGKYFHQVTGDIASARKDLQWVAAQSPDAFKDAYPWRMHFISDAKVQMESL